MNGILFKDEMVLPILNTKPDVWPAQPIDKSGAFKWQTRRKLNRDVTPEPSRFAHYRDTAFVPVSNSGKIGIFSVPFVKSRYKAGDVLYVKEVFTFNEKTMRGYFRADMQYWDHAKNEPRKECGEPDRCKWTSPLIMPAKAARLWVKIMNVRVERVKDISEADAMAEGCCIALRGHDDDFARSCYRELYDRINGFGSFERDWCFVYEFQRVNQITEG